MRLRAALIAVTCMIASCGERDPHPAPWQPVGAAGLTESQRAQQSKAIAARDAMFAELVSTLSGEVQASGPAAAIRVCEDKAPMIAASVADRFGVRIGRTSRRLRSLANAAPAWTDALLADRPEEARMAAGPRGLLGVTMPIRVAGKCLACHGPTESIPSDVQEALASLYPQDEATGYREGDLRGWFWVEVPAQPE